MTHPFCPKCGKDTKELFDGFCVECYTGKKSFVQLPKEIRLRQCKHCNSVFLGGKWQRFDLQLIKSHTQKKIIITGLKNPKINMNFLEKAVKICLTGKLSGKEVEQEFEIPFYVNIENCDACMKKSSQFWEAKVQLRKAQNFDSERYNKIQRRMQHLAHFEKATKTGPDFYFISKDDIKDELRYLKKQGIKFIESRRFAGMTKQHVRKIKYTYCIRV